MITRINTIFTSIVLISLFHSCSEKSSNNDNTVVEVKTDNHFTKLRTQALNLTPDQIGLDSLIDNEVFGVIMDWNMGDAVVTLVSFKTGDASIYLSTGQSFIGGYNYESIINAAKHFVISGEKYLSNAQKVDTIASPDINKVGFYFLTITGRYYIEDNITSIENNTSNLSELFGLANNVIAEYRLISDK